MFSNTFISLTLFCFSIFSLIGLSFGDAHTAFDVSEDTTDNGGCQPTERTAVEAAFTEAMEMVGLIKNAITSIQAGTEAPAVGWIFNALFGIQATEDLNDRGIGRPQEQTVALAAMTNLFRKLEDHSTAVFQTPNVRGVFRKSRVFCNQNWVKPTDRQINQATGAPTIPVFFLPDNTFPPTVHWYDIQIDFYLVPATNLVEPKKLVCGANNAGFTSTESNVINFCPLQFERPITVAARPAPFAGALPPNLLDHFNTMSMTFLHEYTHLVGRASFGDAQNPIPDVNLFPEHYQFPAATQLPKTSGISNTLRNADSYAMLGVALKLSQCDWRDGACRSPAYWAGVRRQRLEVAQTLLGMRPPAGGS